MDADSYFTKVVEGYEFLIAFLSLIGFIGLLVGFAMLFLLGRYNRSNAFKIIIISIIILSLTPHFYLLLAIYYKTL